MWHNGGCYRMGKKKTIGIVIFILILPLYIGGCSTENNFSLRDLNELKMGDYLTFGKYNDVPIIWRVINIDIEGNPMLFSDNILSLKAFDSSGNYHKEKDRQTYGSNYWRNSNIRQWLNSSEQSIKWIQNAPSNRHLLAEFAPYEYEKGFLADGNFTENERLIIKPVNHKSILHDVDKYKKQGGSEHIILDSDIRTLIQNYDSSYYENIEDKVFLLSIKELYEYVWKNKKILGEDYYIGKPTNEAVELSPEKHPDLSHDSNWYSWLRTPDTSNSGAIVRNIHNDGKVFSYFAYTGPFGGIRPALVLDLSKITISSGIGIESKPYIIEGDS